VKIVENDIDITNIKLVIYKITNMVNGKIYIGKTIQGLKNRISGHRSDANRYNKSGKNKNYLISRAISKYGFINFNVEAIDIAINQEWLNIREMYWIKYFNSTNKKIGYNVLPGGRGIWTEEIIDKMSKSHKGKIPYNKGIPMLEAQKIKLRTPKSQETKDKIGKANTGKIRSEEFKKHASIVNSVISEDVIIEIRNLYATGNYLQKEIADLFCINNGTVSRIINGKRRK
jgi:group I intron endonuclease